MFSVIVIDDSYLMRSTVSNYIEEQLEYFTVSASFADGDQALEYLKNHPTDVVVTDIRMFRVSGLDIAKQIHENYPQTSVVIISGYSEFEYAKKSIQYGVKNYILKPIDFDELFQCFIEIQKDLMRSQPPQVSEGSDNGGLFLIYAFSGIYQDEQELRRIAKKELPFSVDHTPIIIISVSIERLSGKQTLNQEKLSPLIERQLTSLLPATSAYFLWARGFRYFFVLTGSDVDTDAVCRDFYQHTGLSAQIQVLYRAASVLEMTRQLPDKWFGHCMHESLTGLSQNPSVKPSIGQRAKKDLLVQQAKEFMQKNYMRDISREDVAGAVYISHSYLSHIFTEITGMSYIEYLTKIRMEKAIELLHQNKKVNEIAKLVGYHNRKTFLNNFREYTNCSPSDIFLNTLSTPHRHLPTKRSICHDTSALFHYKGIRLVNSQRISKDWSGFFRFSDYYNTPNLLPL